MTKSFPLFFGLSLALAQIYAEGKVPIIGKNYTPKAEANKPIAIEKPQGTSDVFLSSPATTFELQGTALLLQPTASNLHYAAETDPLPVVSSQWKIDEINTDYHWGFDLALRGILHTTHTSISLNWERFRSTDSTSKYVPSTHRLGSFFRPEADVYKKARGKVSFHFDEVNLDYGIFLNLGDRLQTNLFTGVSFAHVKQILISKFSSLDNTMSLKVRVPSTFNGAGPQLGLNFSYRIFEGFCLTGKAAVALLVGTQKNHTNYTTFSPELEEVSITPPNRQKDRVHKKTQLVPGVDGRLGLAYLFTLYNHYLVKLEAGYEAKIYLNAIQSIDMGTEVPEGIAEGFGTTTPPTIGVFANSFMQTLSNFALAGPYFRLDIGF